MCGLIAAAIACGRLHGIARYRLYGYVCSIITLTIRRINISRFCVIITRLHEISCETLNLTSELAIPQPRAASLDIEALQNLVLVDVAHLQHLLDDLRIFNQGFDPFVIGNLVPRAAVPLWQILGRNVFVQAVVVVAVEVYPVTHISVEQRLEDGEDRVKDPRLMQNV